MTARTGTTAKQHPQTSPAEGSSEQRINLSYRYGTIGIQAVAAAARYSDVRKKPTQVANRIDLRFVEAI